MTKAQLTAKRRKKAGQLESGLPAGLANPARRALAQAACEQLEQVAQLTEAEIKQLHGIGPKALDQLRRALLANGLSFASK